MSKFSIILIIPYFGQWPKWINHFMLSCMYNRDIDWLFFTDCGKPELLPDNVKLINISFNDYKKLVSDKLNINFIANSPYKLCDLRPAYGLIHENEIKKYDFFGFGDIDVIYGDIRKFASDKLLENHQLFSTSANRISGHFCLLKNTSLIKNAFKKIPHWKSLFENENHLSIDESNFTKVFIPHRKHPDWLKKLYSIFSPYWRNNYFKEQYSTILAPHPWTDGSSSHPQEWFWKKGHLTNSHDNGREYMYLHFMNWKSSRWLAKEHGSIAAWEEFEPVFQFNDKTEKSGIKLTRKGFYNL